MTLRAGMPEPGRFFFLGRHLSHWVADSSTEAFARRMAVVAPSGALLVGCCSTGVVGAWSVDARWGAVSTGRRRGTGAGAWLASKARTRPTWPSQGMGAGRLEWANS